MATLTLSELRDAVKQRADMTNSNFIDDTEWNRYINSAITELRDLLISAFGEDYFSNEADLSFSTGVNSIALPADFYKMLGVDLVLSNNDKISLKQFNFHERNNRRSSYGFRGSYYSNYKYRIQGSNLKLEPKAEGALTLHIFYIPKFTYLSDDSDEFDGFNGWEEYVIVRAAIMGLIKEESDISEIGQELQMLKDRIQTMAFNRDAGEVSTITNSARDYRSMWSDDLWQ